MTKAMIPEGEHPIRLLLAERYTLVLAGLKLLLHEDPGIDVIGATTSGREALHVILHQRPDVAVLDVDLEEIGALAVLDQLREEKGGAHVLVLSGCVDQRSVQEALFAGARGYVLKQGTSASLLHAIRSVREGGLYVDPDVAEACAAAALSLHPAGRVQPHPRAVTAQEEGVIRLIALGYTAKEIGDRLGISARSVEALKARATDKLDLRHRTKIVQYGVMRGWFCSSAAVMLLLSLALANADPTPRVPAVATAWKA